MRPYETLVVLSNTLGAETQGLVDRLHSVIKERGGRMDASHDWGHKRLAYTVKKETDGHYFLLEYEAEPDAVLELERQLRITDGVLRYLSVQQEHTGLPKPREREAPRGDAPMHEMRSPGRDPRDAPPGPPTPAASQPPAAAEGEGAAAAAPASAPAAEPSAADTAPSSPPSAGTPTNEGADDQGVKTDE